MTEGEYKAAAGSGDHAVGDAVAAGVGGERRHFECGGRRMERRAREQQRSWRRRARRAWRGVKSSTC